MKHAKLIIPHITQLTDNTVTTHVNTNSDTTYSTIAETNKYTTTHTPRIQRNSIFFSTPTTPNRNNQTPELQTLEQQPYQPQPQHTKNPQQAKTSQNDNANVQLPKNPQPSNKMPKQSPIVD